MSHRGTGLVKGTAPVLQFLKTVAIFTGTALAPKPR